MGLSSYLLLIGLFASSKTLARDALVRKELYQVAEEQVSLFRNIGCSRNGEVYDKEDKTYNG